MRAFTALFFTLALTSLVTADPDKYEMMLKNWGKMKAMEGCFGEANMKIWTLRMKKAKAMCSGKPAIELELPMFQGKAQMANALSAGVDNKNSEQNDFIDNLMRKAYINKMMKRQMLELMGADDDMDMPFVARLRSRFTRATEEETAEDMDMADKDISKMMLEKLNHMEMSIISDIGNMTCVLMEVGIINADNELDLAAMNKKTEDYKWTAEENGDGVDRTWLKAKMNVLHGMCVDLADAVPDSILNNCEMPHYITRIIYFKKCMHFHKTESCMMSDVMNKVSHHGMSIEELSEKAGKKPETTAGLLAMVMFGKM